MKKQYRKNINTYHDDATASPPSNGWVGIACPSCTFKDNQINETTHTGSLVQPRAPWCSVMLSGSP